MRGFVWRAAQVHVLQPVVPRLARCDLRIVEAVGRAHGRAGRLRRHEGQGRDWLCRQSPYVKFVYQPYDWGLNSVR